MRTYQVAVTYQSSALAARQFVQSAQFEIKSLQPIKDVNDLALLHAIARLPANSTITEVRVEEQRPSAVAA